MTAQRSFKRLVRARMAKTGESYTAARAQLLAGADEDAKARGVPWLACSDERIRERTGRGWEEWFELLDSWDAEAMDHTALARRVSQELEIHILAWDAQAITTSFERSRGKRAVGERVGGDGFVASVSKTMKAGAEEVFTAFVDPSRRAGWLPGLELSERTVTKPKVARYDVAGGPTRLVMTVEAKGADKCTIAVEQSRLAGTEERDARKAYWRDALASLQAEVERDR
jgi:hypothetical protein